MRLTNEMRNKIIENYIKNTSKKMFEKLETSKIKIADELIIFYKSTINCVGDPKKNGFNLTSIKIYDSDPINKYNYIFITPTKE